MAIRKTIYGTVLTPEFASLAFQETWDRYWTSQIGPLLDSFADIGDVLSPAGYALRPPILVRGDVLEGVLWASLDEPGPHITRLIYDLVSGNIASGYWTWKFNTVGRLDSAGPFSKDLKTDFYSSFVHDCLRRTFRQDKKRISGVWVARKFQIRPEIRDADTRRVPLR